MSWNWIIMWIWRKLVRSWGLISAFWGNLDPVAVLARGRVEQVMEAADNAFQIVRVAGHRRFVLSSGCTLAMETPAENLDAMLQVARQSKW